MKLTIVGLGPGGGADLTGRAREALQEAELIVGYTTYIRLIREDFPEQELLATGMRKEEDRCRMAIEQAASGRRVAMVCSGDPGVYGMASLCMELAQSQAPELEIQVIPGVTAATGGAALLGAPLNHDFAVISLSDLLTPWETIERRLRLAAQGDFALCLYNPASKTRTDHLRRACEILLEVLPPETTCGMVRSIGREGESRRILTLEQLKEAPCDMLTTVYVGNSSTRVIGERLVTPRGYLQREKP